MAEQLSLPAAVIAAALRDTVREGRVARFEAFLASGGDANELRAALLDAIHDPTTDIRRRALGLIPDLPGGPADYAEAISAGLKDNAWTVRETAAQAARHLPDADGTMFRTLLAHSLTDSSPHVRRAAAVSAGPLIEPERDYGAAIRHKFERQRMRAALAVAHAREERTAEALLLLRIAMADSHAKVRRAALGGLLLLPRAAVRSLLPCVVRRCAEADSAVASTASEVWAFVLKVPDGDEPLSPLRPFAGNNVAPDLQGVIESLPEVHLLRRCWNAMPTKPDATLTPQRFARLLAQLCESVLYAGRAQG
ncbi:MAG: hypothetical protein C0467_24380 [Planctomycetaceae bacterium]|nr:hypothetical protein [Planctomycetaceae bacterium]